MAHKLFIDIQDSAADNRYIQVTDLSFYDSMLEVKDRILQVLYPGAEKYVILPFPRNQANAYTPISMGITEKICEDLPDGIYKFHFSVAPASKVFSFVCHYRVSNIMNQVLGKMISLSSDDCNKIDNNGNLELTKTQNSLLHIWMMLKGVQAIAIDEFTITHAEDLYKQAVRNFNKLNNPLNC